MSRESGWKHGDRGETSSVMSYTRHLLSHFLPAEENHSNGENDDNNDTKIVMTLNEPHPTKAAIQHQFLEERRSLLSSSCSVHNISSNSSLRSDYGSSAHNSINMKKDPTVNVITIKGKYVSLQTDGKLGVSCTPADTPSPRDDLEQGLDSSSINDEPPSVKVKVEDRKSYITLCLLYIVYGISYSLLIPALPGLTLRLTAGDTGRSSMLYGTATSIRYALEFFSAPILGSLADVKGRKFVFVLAFAVCALELLLLTFYPSIQMIFLTRAMSGLGDAGVAAAYAMVTDIAMHNQDIVAQQYGLLGAMTGLAFIVGPYLGGRLMEIDMDLCFFVAAIIAITGGVLSFIFLEETKPMLEEAETHGIVGQDCGDEQIHDKDRQLTEQSTPSNRCSLCINFNPLEGLKSHLNNPSLRVLLVPLALSAVNLGIPFIWYMYMHHTFHATASQIGLFLSFHGLMNAIAQGLFIRVVIPRFLTERNAAVYGLLVVALHTVCYGLCQETWQLFAVALIFCLSIIHYPALKAIVVCESLECRNEVQFQANLQGAISSIRTASIACGSILYTSLFSYGISLEPMPLQQLPFLVAGAIYVTAFFALASALRTIDRRRSEQQHHVGNGHRSASYDERRTSSPTTTLSPNTLYQRIAQKSGGTVSSSESLTATSVSLIANNNDRLSSYQRSQGEYELVQLNPAHHQ